MFVSSLEKLPIFFSLFGIKNDIYLVIIGNTLIVVTAFLSMGPVNGLIKYITMKDNCLLPCPSAYIMDYFKDLLTVFK